MAEAKQTKRWYYNLKTNRWDYVIEVTDNPYGDDYCIAFRWEDDEWKQRILTPHSAVPLTTPDENDFAFWYSSTTTGMAYPHPDRNGDGGVLGEIKMWTGEGWRTMERNELDANRETYLIIHGNLNTYDQQWIKDIANGLEGKGNPQILALDWGDMANEKWPVAGDPFATGIIPAAQRAAVFLRQMLGDDLDSFVSNHLNVIGHSYGCHLTSYLASYIPGTIKSLTALDAAEETYQRFDHPVQLSPLTAQKVTFYKSSGHLGGEEEFGHCNFVLVNDNSYKLNSKQWVGGLTKTESHGYAYEHYIDSLYNPHKYVGYNFETEHSYISQVLSYPSSYGNWAGIIGSSGKVQCLTQGYETGYWTPQEYASSLESVISKSGSVYDSFIHWLIVNDGMEIGKGDNIEGYISPRISAVSGLTDLSVINPNSKEPTLEINGASKDGEALQLKVDDTYYVSTAVWNNADNTAFTKEYLIDAQRNQNSEYQVWLSSSSDGFNESKSILLSHAPMYVAAQDFLGVSLSDLKITISKEQVEQLVYGSNDSALIAQYSATGEADLYVYGRAGVDAYSKISFPGTPPTSYQFIAGELYAEDNTTPAQKVTVATKEGIQLIFVVDDTGSMSEEIGSVKNALVRLIESYRQADGSSEGPRMQLITFKDSVTTRLTTSNLDDMLDAVRSLSASGGDDEPEYSDHAIARAVDNIGKGGSILFFTDAPSHEGPNMNAVMTKAQSKNVKINPIISGSMGSYASTASYSSAAYAVSTMALDEISEDETVESIAEEPTVDDTAESAVTMSVGESVSGTVHYGEDPYDWYTITLDKHAVYTFTFTTEEYEGFLNLYDADGTTLLKSIEQGESFTLNPDDDSTYYLRVRAYLYDDTPYTLTVQQTAAPSEIGSTRESFSILAAETGGMMLHDKGGSSAFESAVYNVVMSVSQPTVVSCGPNAVKRGTTMTVTLTGANTNWKPGETEVRFGSEHIRVVGVEVKSAITLMATIEIDSTCELDSLDVTVISGSETATGYDVLTVQSAPTSRQILGVETDSFMRGSEFTATIRGYNTGWTEETLQSISLGPGVEITGYEVVSETLIRVAGVITADAQLGYRTVQVVNDGTTTKLASAVFVSAYSEGLPRISLTSSGSVTVGKETLITIKAENMDFSTGKISVDLGTGIDVLNVEVVDATTLNVKLVAGEDAVLGYRNISVKLDDREAILSNGLDILPFNDVPEKSLSLELDADNKHSRVDSVGGDDAADYFFITPVELGVYSVNLENLSAPVELSVGIRNAEGEFEPARTLMVTPSAPRQGLDGFNVEAGDNLYIRVIAVGEGVSAYKLNLEGKNPPAAVVLDYDDNAQSTAPDLAWEAPTTENDGGIKGWVGTADAVDIYRLTMDEAGKVSISLSELETNARLRVMRDNGKGGSTQVAALAARRTGLDRELSLSAGTYYLQVESYDNGAGRYNTVYALDVELGKDAEKKQGVIAAIA